MLSVKVWSCPTYCLSWFPYIWFLSEVRFTIGIFIVENFAIFQLHTSYFTSRNLLCTSAFPYIFRLARVYNRPFSLVDPYRIECTATVLVQCTYSIPNRWILSLGMCLVFFFVNWRLACLNLGASLNNKLIPHHRTYWILLVERGTCYISTGIWLLGALRICSHRRPSTPSLIYLYIYYVSGVSHLSIEKPGCTSMSKFFGTC